MNISYSCFTSSVSACHITLNFGQYSQSFPFPRSRSSTSFQFLSVLFDDNPKFLSERPIEVIVSESTHLSRLFEFTLPLLSFSTLPFSLPTRRCQLGSYRPEQKNRERYVPYDLELNTRLLLTLRFLSSSMTPP